MKGCYWRPIKHRNSYLHLQYCEKVETMDHDSFRCTWITMSSYRRFLWFMHAEGDTSAHVVSCVETIIRMNECSPSPATIIFVPSHIALAILSLSVPFIPTFIIFRCTFSSSFYSQTHTHTRTQVKCTCHRSLGSRMYKYSTLRQFICNFMTFPVPEWSHFRRIFRLRCHCEPLSFR